MSRDERRGKPALNYTSARNRAEKQASGFSGSFLKIPDGVKMFKPKAGLIIIDIIPFIAGKGNPWAEEGCIHWERTFYAHRGVGANQETLLCPRATAKKPCPVCEYRAKLRSQGDESDEQTIKELAEKQRQLFNIIDRKNPSEGIQLWDMSYHLFGRALDARLRNSEEQDGWDQFFFLEGGFSLRVGLVEKSFGGFTYIEAESIDFKPRKDYEESILEESHCLDDLLIVKPYEEIKSTFLEVGGSKGKAEQEADPEPEAPRRRSREPEADQDPEPPRKKPAAREQEPEWDDFDKKPKKPAAREEDPEPDPEPPRRRPAREEQEPEEDRPRRRPAREPEPEDPEPEQSEPKMRPLRKAAPQDPEPDPEPPRRKPAARPARDEEADPDERPHVRSYNTPPEDPEPDPEPPRRKPAAREEDPAPRKKPSKDDWD